tara:strand:- start:4209 stop:4655 length:447 start_codon:yes stop_codon:yes gene_type:complete
MWKKAFDQDNNLTAHICKQDTFVIHEEAYYLSQQTKTKEIEENNSDFLEDDEDEKDEDYWDANIMPSHMWTSKKMSSFLSSFPNRVPKLLQIIKKQTNVYHCNPSFLCKFESIDGTADIWIIGALLYHTIDYREAYQNFQHKLTEKSL